MFCQLINHLIYAILAYSSLSTTIGLYLRHLIRQKQKAYISSGIVKISAPIRPITILTMCKAGGTLPCIIASMMTLIIVCDCKRADVGPINFVFADSAEIPNTHPTSPNKPAKKPYIHSYKSRLSSCLMTWTTSKMVKPTEKSSQYPNVKSYESIYSVWSTYFIRIIPRVKITGMAHEARTA